MTEADLDEVLALQGAGYPASLHDSAAAFRSRMTLAPDLNLTARRNGALAGYLVSHPWRRGAPPPVDAVLGEAPEGADACWYVHDLSVAADQRGTGVTAALLASGAAAARTRGLGHSELIAVAGAEGFWAKQGWRRVEPLDPDLAAKVAGYGALAVFMAKAPL